MKKVIKVNFSFDLLVKNEDGCIEWRKLHVVPQGLVSDGAIVGPFEVWFLRKGEKINPDNPHYVVNDYKRISNFITDAVSRGVVPGMI